MNYLVIENPGVCPVEGFTVLGVSTARGNESAIGQFGSGAKHGVLTCIRHGLNPLIWCGNTRVEFSTEMRRLPNGHAFNMVQYSIDRKKAVDSGFSLEFGALDWTELDMALREFISNAIDSADGDAKKINIRFMDKPRSIPNGTVVAIPVCPEVNRFYQSLPKKFLHFAGNEVLTGVLEKKEPGAAAIYRKGVFVREVERNSLFDYNCGSDLTIDESRNLDDWRVVNAACVHLMRSNKLSEAIKAIALGSDCWESTFSGYSLTYEASRNKENVQKAWREAFGDNAVIAPCSEFLQMARNKGFNCIPINRGEWYKALQNAGVQTVFQVLDDVNENGCQYRDALPETVQIVDTIWKCMSDLQLTNGKEKPSVRSFVKIMAGGSELCGYYKDSTVYVNIDHKDNWQTILEEIAHHVTGAADATRDFQDYVLRLAASVMRYIME